MLSSFNPLLSATLTAIGCRRLRCQEAGDKFRLCVTADTVIQVGGEFLNLSLRELLQFFFAVVATVIRIS